MCNTDYPKKLSYCALVSNHMTLKLTLAMVKGQQKKKKNDFGNTVYGICATVNYYKYT